MVPTGSSGGSARVADVRAAGAPAVGARAAAGVLEPARGGAVAVRTAVAVRGGWREEPARAAVFRAVAVRTAVRTAVLALAGLSVAGCMEVGSSADRQPAGHPSGSAGPTGRTSSGTTGGKSAGGARTDHVGARKLRALQLPPAGRARRAARCRSWTPAPAVRPLPEPCCPAAWSPSPVARARPAARARCPPRRACRPAPRRAPPAVAGAASAGQPAGAARPAAPRPARALRRIRRRPPATPRRARPPHPPRRPRPAVADPLPPVGLRLGISDLASRFAFVVMVRLWW